MSIAEETDRAIRQLRALVVPPEDLHRYEENDKRRKQMASDNVENRRGRQKGEKFASASDVFMAILSGSENLRKLEEDKSISYNALHTAKEMLEKAKQKVPAEVEKMLAEREPTTGTKSEPNKIGGILERVISENRGQSPVLFQVPMDAYKVEAGDVAVITFEKDGPKITFKKSK